jgi:hypothetical protein
MILLELPAGLHWIRIIYNKCQAGEDLACVAAMWNQLEKAARHFGNRAKIIEKQASI